MSTVTITITPTPAVTDEQVDTTTPPPPPAPAPTLPPQTTPFVPIPGPEACELSVYCKFLSQYVYQTIQWHGGHPLGGQQCTAAQTSKLAAGSVLAHLSRCYPEGYFDIFSTISLRPKKRDEWDHGAIATTAAAAAQQQQQELHNEEERDFSSAMLDSTLAYPGSECMAGWTTACTTTVTREGWGYPQAWCCPPGQWACAQAEGDRRCSSTMTGKTAIWLTWDPPFTSQDGYEWYTYPTWVTRESVENAATVWHDVFPLQMAVAGGGGGALRLQPSARDVNNSENNSNQSVAVAEPPFTHHWFRDAAAGGNGGGGGAVATTSSNRAMVVVAAAVFVIWPLATLIMLIKRRRHNDITRKRIISNASADLPRYHPEGVSLRTNPQGVSLAA